MRLQFEVGVVAKVDVLRSEVLLAQAKNNYLKAMYDNNSYRAKLDKSMGVPIK